MCALTIFHLKEYNFLLSLYRISSIFCFEKLLKKKKRKIRSKIAIILNYISIK